MKKYHIKYEDLEVDATVCCDYCMEVLYYQFECPICKEESAGCDLEPYEEWKEFTCLECDSKFVIDYD